MHKINKSKNVFENGDQKRKSSWHRFPHCPTGSFLLPSCNKAQSPTQAGLERPPLVGAPLVLREVVSQSSSKHILCQRHGLGYLDYATANDVEGFPMHYSPHNGCPLRPNVAHHVLCRVQRDGRPWPREESTKALSLTPPTPPIFERASCYITQAGLQFESLWPQLSK